jgi:hypothetical protein
VKTLKLSLLSAIVLIVLAACSSEGVQVEGTITPQDFGTSARDTALDVAAPKGGVGAVVVGATGGALDGANKGEFDAFIRKYDGGVVWGEQFGTRSDDGVTNVAVTGTGVSYALGVTRGALGFKVGFEDVFLRKYNRNGVLQWTRQFGTIGRDLAIDVTLDSNGNVYVLSRDGKDGFIIRKFNPSGTLLKTITNATAGLSLASASALAVDSKGTISMLVRFVSDTTNFVTLVRYDSNGAPLPSLNVFTGVGTITPYDLVFDGSTLFFSLFDSGTNKGGYIGRVTSAGLNLFLIRIEPSATGAVSRPVALSLDNISISDVYVTGTTTGAYPGFTNAGEEDIFVLKYTAAGSHAWTQQFGGNSRDSSSGITAVSDAVYVAGSSTSNPNLVGDTSHGGEDAFLAQLDLRTGTLLGIDQ